jgi:hypothetical protein
LVPLPEHGSGDHGAEVACAAGDENLHDMPFRRSLLMVLFLASSNFSNLLISRQRRDTSSLRKSLNISAFCMTVVIDFR